MNSASTEDLEIVLERMLNKYFKRHETWYYINYIKSKGSNVHDRYLQVMQIIRDKENQRKFCEQTKAYQRRNLQMYGFAEGLHNAYGWKLPELKNK